MASGSETPATPGASSGDYPVQRHAGKVGYGPNYNASASVIEVVEGVFEEVTGKIIRKPKLVAKGHQLHTGELKKKKLLGEGDEPDPIFSGGKADDKVGPKKIPSPKTVVEPTDENPHPYTYATAVASSSKEPAPTASSPNVPSKGKEALERVTSH